MKAIKKCICYILLTFFVLDGVINLECMQVEAATQLSGKPYAKIEYGYTNSVSCGTIRYVNQRSGSGYYYSNYWGGKNAREGCAAACVSMALSYVGVNRTPAQCSDANAYAYWSGSYDGATELNHNNTSLQTMINNYLNGNGKYSPPIVWLGRYGNSNWHYVLIVGYTGGNTYQILDPWEDSMWNMQINGTTLYYTTNNDGGTGSGGTVTDAYHQYYNPSATVVSEEIPVISNAKVSNISTTGYTVTCTVTKDANLNRVEFPTWTTKNGQDDLPSKWPEGTRSGNNYTFRVNIADHNYEDGEYITHIYAWTNGGKKAAISLPSVTISKNVQQTHTHSWSVKSRVEPTCTSAGKITYICTGSGGTTWGPYGNWSAWSNTKVTESDSRQVETRQVAATYRTEYNYSKWSQYNSATAGGWSGPSKGYWGGVYCGNYVERGWSTEKLSIYTYSDGIPLYGRSGNTWYNETSRQAVATNAYTQYRYRDRSKVSSGCNETKTETIAATGHKWDSGKVTKSATCIAKGIKTYTCTKCNATKTEEIPVTGHKKVTDVAVAATCTKAGKTAGSHCSVCGTVITAQQTIPATGHSWDSGKVTKQPTTSSTGVMTYTCTKCKTTKTETIPKLTVSNKPGVSYTTHIQSIGWQGVVRNGDLAGTVGDSKRLEAIKINLENAPYSGGIEYRTHVQTYGWQGWVKNGALSGTSGQAKRLEAIQIRLTGEMAKHYDVYYRIQVQSFGWLGWAKNGEYSGSAGHAKRLEAIQIVLVEKGKSIDRNVLNKQAKITSSTKVTDSTPYVTKMPSIHYQTHVQSIGWQDRKSNGDISGTIGQSKRLEAIKIDLSKPPYDGGIRYRTHIQSIGWQGWKYDGAISGTSGQSKRLEAICIELTGEMAEHYDVYYRVHAQSYGWLAWAKNGQNAGTSGGAKRLEGIQIVLVEKGKAGPGSTYGGVKSTRNEAYIQITAFDRDIALYKSILDEHCRGFEAAERGDDKKVEEYYSKLYLIDGIRKGDINSTGFAFKDINNDGIDELFIGYLFPGEAETGIENIYTYENGKVYRIAGGTGWTRNSVNLLKDNTFFTVAFGGANIHAYSLSSYNSSTKKLVVKEEYENYMNQWTYRSGNSGSWKDTSAEKGNSFVNKNQSLIVKFNYTSFSKYYSQYY